MSRMRNFLSGLATGIGNEMQRNEEIQRQLTVQEALEKRRLALQQEAADRAREQGIQDRNAELQAGGPTPGYDAKGQPGLMQRALEIDPVTKAARGSSTRVGDVPVTVVSRGTQKTAAGTVTGTYMSDGRFLPDGDPMPPGSGYGGGSGGNSLGRAVKGPDGNWYRLGADGSPSRIEGMGEAPGKTDKGDTAYRSALEKERSRAATFVNKQLERYSKMPEPEALKKIYEETGVRAPSVAAYRENQIQAALSPWMEANPAPAAAEGRTYPTPTPAAFAELGDNPSPADIAEFEQVFGPGSARRGRR